MAMREPKFLKSMNDQKQVGIVPNGEFGADVEWQNELWKNLTNSNQGEKYTVGDKAEIPNRGPPRQ